MKRDGKEESMSHVDEGTLHAYLDGELSSSERAAVDAHLGQCGECRAALAEERALLERASALLGSAPPRPRAPRAPAALVQVRAWRPPPGGGAPPPGPPSPLAGPGAPGGGRAPAVRAA